MKQGRTPWETLRQEHEIVADLLIRLREMGERMRTGERVSPRRVQLGLGLLDAYLHRVHMRQFDIELWPEANAIAGPECAGPLELTRERHLEARRTAHRLLGLTSRWAQGDRTVQFGIAQGLQDLAEADEATNRFEEHHPFVCLSSSLPPASQARLRDRFDGHAGTKGVLEANIARFLEATRASL